MSNRLKISLWSLVLAATTIGAVLSMPLRASPPELASGPAHSSVTAADALSRSADAGSFKSFGFLEFDWDPNAAGGLPGFDPWPNRELHVANAN